MNPLRKLVEGLWRIDLRLVVLAMRVSHAIDYRFHRNQFQQGAAVLTLALALEVAQAARIIQSNWGSWYSVAAMVLASGMTVVVYAGYLQQLERASRDMEANPSRITFEMAVFIIFSRPFRLGILVIGTLVWAPSLVLAVLLPMARTIFSLICDTWAWWVAVAFYLAGGIPPTRKRKAKKEKAQPLLAAAPNQA